MRLLLVQSNPEDSIYQSGNCKMYTRNLPHLSPPSVRHWTIGRLLCLYARVVLPSSMVCNLSAKFPHFQAPKNIRYMVLVNIPPNNKPVLVCVCLRYLLFFNVVRGLWPISSSLWLWVSQSVHQDISKWILVLQNYVMYMLNICGSNNSMAI